MNERLSTRIVKQAKNRPTAGTGLAWVIVREILDPGGAFLECEFAQRGARFAEPGSHYGRWVGGFEFDREAGGEDLIQDDYLETMITSPMRPAGKYQLQLWPFADQGGNYGDTTLQKPTLLLAVEMDDPSGAMWQVLQTPLRFAVKETSDAAIAGDCKPVEAAP